MLKKFLVQIWAYDYHAKFEVLAEDSESSIEKSILDKIGEKSIKCENLGNAYHDRRPVQTKTVLGVRVAV